jgi:hypothetical protein
VTVVTIGQVDANFLGSLHLELLHSLLSLGNIDLVVLVAHFVSLLFLLPRITDRGSCPNLCSKAFLRFSAATIALPKKRKL